jgi:hypothetical protein
MQKEGGFCYLICDFVGNASNYLFLQKVNSTLFLCQLGSEALLALGQLMTASMPTPIGCNITGIRPTHDCFYANLHHM